MELACGCKYDEKTGKGVICVKHVPQKWKEELKELESPSNHAKLRENGEWKLIEYLR